MSEDNELKEENSEIEETVAEIAEEISEDIEEVEKLRLEANDYKHKYLHALADTENARKRLQKDRQELMNYATRTLMTDFLNPIDNMENALGFSEQASEEVKNWAHGFKMILTQFRDVLTNNNVRPINTDGKLFDPHFHEAVETVKTNEHPEGTLLEVHMKGYMIGDKVLRPARVTVAQEPKVEHKEKAQEEEKQLDEENNKI